jgi:hypothetical protein
MRIPSACPALSGAIVLLAACSSPPEGATKSSTASLDRIPANHPQRSPASVPLEYAATPHGFFHPSCMARIEPGETVLPDGSIRTVAGETRPVAPCTLDRFDPTGRPMPIGSAGQPAMRAVPAPASAYDGWVENYSSTTTGPLSSLSATWVVPATPSAAGDGQTIFFFNGLQALPTTESILQPVLAFENGQWSATSWNCCKSGTTYYGNSINVSPGDVIVGTMTGSQCDASTGICQSWSIETLDQNTGESAVLQTQSWGVALNWVFAAVLEVYGVASCSDLPTSGSLAFDNQAYTTVSGGAPSANWQLNVGQVSPPCGYGGTAAGSSVTLDFSSAYVGPPPYAAQFVSQSFPPASTALTMVEGQTLPSYIELKNVGASAWDSSTHLGTTQARDRASVFADSSWLAPNRPAGVTGTVAPGASAKLAFDLHAPDTPGTYFEYFGVVEENVAWFSDPGQGGPADNFLEVQVNVVAPEYRGDFKDQTFPLAPAALTVHAGDVASGYVELTNSGTQTWKAGTTKLAPIPRDQASPFADASWLSPTRVSTVTQDVPPGAVGRFDVKLDAAKPGDFTIGLGLVEEGVTWFADATAGGGPQDGLLAVHLVVTPAASTLDGGASADSGGDQGGGDAGGEADGGSTPDPGGGGLDAAAARDSGSGAAFASDSAGCSIGPTRADGGSSGAMAVLGAVALVTLRKRTCRQEPGPQRFSACRASTPTPPSATPHDAVRTYGMPPR